MKSKASFLIFIILALSHSSTIYGNNQFMQLQEKRVPYEFLSRRTEAQLGEICKLYNIKEYFYNSSKIYKQKGGTVFETAVFVSRTEDGECIEEVCLLVLYKSKDTPILIQKEGNVSVLWDSDKYTSTGDVIINGYSGNEKNYYTERLAEAKQGAVGYTIELKGDNLSGLAILKIVPKTYPFEFDTNLAETFSIEYTENSNNSIIIMLLCILAVLFVIAVVGKKSGRNE